METVFLSLGSNIEEREVMIAKAVQMLSKFLRNVRVSALYEGEPWGMSPDAPWFLNAVVKGDTDLSAEDLWKSIVKIEDKLGRDRLKKEEYPPCTIDIDILFYGNHIIKTPELTIPHPLMQERMFVIKPLAEISFKFRHPVLQKTVWEMLRDCQGTSTVNIYNKIE